MIRLASLLQYKLRVNFISLSVKISVKSNMQVLKNLIDQMVVNSVDEKVSTASYSQTFEENDC